MILRIGLRIWIYGIPIANDRFGIQLSERFPCPTAPLHSWRSPTIRVITVITVKIVDSTGIAYIVGERIVGLTGIWLSAIDTTYRNRNWPRTRRCRPRSR